jgi:two-component system sensor histidine kinase AlgZ
MGNRMATENIRERLQLHFDAEASMQSQAKDGFYRVTIRIPYIKAGG